MKYTYYQTVFDLKDIESLKSEVSKSVELYLKSGSNLTPAKWALYKRKSWKGLKKASFVYYAVNHPEYINPLKINN